MAVQEQIIVDGGAQAYPEYAVGMGTVPGGGWADGDMLVDFSSNKLVVTYAGSMLSHTLDPSGKPGSASFSVGVGYYSGGAVQASAAHFDDVAATAE